MNHRIEQLRNQLREDPSSRLFFQLGELLRREGEHEEAAEVLRTGLEVFPRYVAAWVSLGRTLFELSSFETAEAAFEEALKLDPENPIASRMLGETAMGREDWVQAIKHLKFARVFSPPDEGLESNIQFVEQRLAETGDLVGEPTTASHIEAKAPADIEPEAPLAGALDEEAYVAPDEMLPVSESESPFGIEDDSEPDEQIADVAVADDIPAMEATSPFDRLDDDPEQPELVDEAADESLDLATAIAVDEAVPGPFDDSEVVADDDPFMMPPAVEYDTAISAGEVFSLSEDDPFRADPPTGDTGVFMLGDDVFGGHSESEVAKEPEKHIDEPDHREEMPPFSEPDVFPQPDVSDAGFRSGDVVADEADRDTVPGERIGDVIDEVVQDHARSEAAGAVSIASDDLYEPAIEAQNHAAEIKTPELTETDVMAEEFQQATIIRPDTLEQYDVLAPPQSEDVMTEDIDEEEAPVRREALPMPTMTLARLALQQGDVELAIETLENVVAADPHNAEAVDLLAQLSPLPVPEPDTGSEASTLSAAKIAALQGWLNNLNIATEERRL